MAEPLPLYTPPLNSAFEGVEVWVTQTGFEQAENSDESGHESGYGFNLGTHVGDDLQQVLARRKALELRVGAPIQWLNQVHGCAVCLADSSTALQSNLQPPLADGSVALSPDVALAVMTADCLPAVLVARNTKGKAVGVAVAHAGWKGLLQGVLAQAALNLAQACKVSCEQIVAWLGPALGPHSFELGIDVQHQFEAAWLQAGPLAHMHPHLNPHQLHACFAEHPKEPTKCIGNLYRLAGLSLAGVGVNEVLGLNPDSSLDTLTNLQWFSYRRAGRLGQPSGRFATVVRLLP